MNEMRKLMETLAQIDEGSNPSVGNMELMDAYEDEDPPHGKRNLDIRGEAVDLNEWMRVMTSALHESGGEYGEFIVKEIYRAFNTLQDELQIYNLKFRPAREGSVALYIHGEYDDLEDVGEYVDKFREVFGRVDELYLYEEGHSGLPGPVLRLWWD